MPLLVSQEAVEVVVAPAGIRVTQEAVEVVLAPADAYVRVTQEVIEVVLGAPPAEPDVWIVRAAPRVRWDAVAEDVLHPRGEWTVNCHPRIRWDDTVTDTTSRWFVRCKPKVTWVTGPGTASTECISAPGAVPPPAEEPPESLELNYVF